MPAPDDTAASQWSAMEDKTITEARRDGFLIGIGVSAALTLALALFANMPARTGFWAADLGAGIGCGCLILLGIIGAVAACGRRFRRWP